MYEVEVFHKHFFLKAQLYESKKSPSEMVSPYCDIALVYVLESKEGTKPEESLRP